MAKSRDARKSEEHAVTEKALCQRRRHIPVAFPGMEGPVHKIDDKIAQDEFRDLLESKFADLEKTLSARESLILKLRLVAVEPETLQQIADRYSISREAVRVAEKKLIAKLKKHMTLSFGDVLRVEFSRPFLGKGGNKPGPANVRSAGSEALTAARSHETPPSYQIFSKEHQ